MDEVGDTIEESTLPHPRLGIFLFFLKLTTMKTSTSAATSQDTRSNQKSSKQTLYPPLPSSFPPGLIALHLLFLAVTILDIHAVLGFANAESALAFYGGYHREPMNQAIHFLGVPLIMVTAFMAGAHLPLMSWKLNLPGMPQHYFSWATLWCIFYNIFYLSVDSVGGALYSPVLYIMYLIAVRWTAHDQKLAEANLTKKADKAKAIIPWSGTGRVLTWALRLHLLSWWVQIVPGHKMIEGAQPALMQSIGGAMTTAPLFAFYEAVWALGLRRDLHHKVLGLVDEYTKDLCEKGVKMRACPIQSN